MLITLGKVLEVLTEENKLRVRTPIFETSGNTAQVILVCSVCHDPGSLNGYKADDTVYVTFTDNDFTRPVVLGKLYLGLENEEGSNFQKANALEVTQSAILPANTKIGDLDFTDISGNLKKVAELDSILSRKQNRLVAGTNITLVDNPNDTTTINATGGGSGLPEISTQTAVIWDLADGLYKWTYNGAKTINYSQGTQAVASIGTVMLQVQSTTGTRKIFLCESAYQSSVYGYVDSATAGGCYVMSKLHGVSTCNGGVLKDIYAPETVGSSGQYLQSNGSGAPTWTTPTHSYRHDIMLYDNAAYFCCFSFINNNPMKYTTSAAISAALVALGFVYANGKFLGANGPHASSTYRAVAGAQGSNVWYLKGDNAWANGDWGSISDVVTQIC